MGRARFVDLRVALPAGAVRTRGERYQQQAAAGASRVRRQFIMLSRGSSAIRRPGPGSPDSYASNAPRRTPGAKGAESVGFSPGNYTVTLLRAAALGVAAYPWQITEIKPDPLRDAEREGSRPEARIRSLPNCTWPSMNVVFIPPGAWWVRPSPPARPPTDDPWPAIHPASPRCSIAPRPRRPGC